MTIAGGIQLRFPGSHLNDFKVNDFCFCLNRFGSMVLVMRRNIAFSWRSVVVPFLSAWASGPRRNNVKMSIDLFLSNIRDLWSGKHIPDPLGF